MERQNRHIFFTPNLSVDIISRETNNHRITYGNSLTRNGGNERLFSIPSSVHTVHTEEEEEEEKGPGARSSLATADSDLSGSVESYDPYVHK